jgi:hypothetical protein
MKKCNAFGFMLLVAFAFSAFAAATASAELVFLLAEWLLNGVAVVLDLVETEGELLLIDLKGFLGAEVMILCSGMSVGFIEPNGLGLVTEILTLSGDTVDSVPLGPLALTCENQVNCPQPLLWAVHLPWLGELELMEEGTSTSFVVLGLEGGNGAPGWYIQCMGIVGEPVDECTAAESVFEVVNGAPTPTGLDSDAITERAGLKLGSCTLGGPESAILEGEGLASVAEGGTLSASSL